MFIARGHLYLFRSVGAECKWTAEHIAPLERRMITDQSYKHGAPPEHCAHSRQRTNHSCAKSLEYVV